MKRRIKFQFNEKIYNVDVERHGNEITVEREGKSYTVTLLPEKKPELKNPQRCKPITTRPSSSTSSSLNPPPEAPGAIADGVLLAPMSGVINKIKTGEGQNIEKDQVVIVMEAMKMYIDVHAPKSGVIEAIFVKKGDNISINQKLLTIK